MVALIKPVHRVRKIYRSEDSQGLQVQTLKPETGRYKEQDGGLK
jgi:hypothetical protein